MDIISKSVSFSKFPSLRVTSSLTLIVNAAPFRRDPNPYASTPPMEGCSHAPAPQHKPRSQTFFAGFQTKRAWERGYPSIPTTRVGFTKLMSMARIYGKVWTCREAVKGRDYPFLSVKREGIYIIVKHAWQSG